MPINLHRNKPSYVGSYLSEKLTNVTLFQSFPKKSSGLYLLQYNCSENTVGKGEIALNKQFLPFPTVFSTFLENCLTFSSDLKLWSPTSLCLEESKLCRLGMG